MSSRDAHPSMAAPKAIRFDGWLLRPEVGELSKDGRKVRLPDQPHLILNELLARPGELVTREQLIARLWPKGVVDFDTGLNSAVRKLRVALRDVADTPRYIETIPRKGYRFIAPVDPDPPPVDLISDVADLPEAVTPVSIALPAEPVDIAALPGPPVPPAVVSYPHRRLNKYIVIGCVALLAVGLSLLALHREPIPTESTNVARNSNLDSKTIAVLPFRSSGAESDQLLARSLSDLVRNRLGALSGMTVIAAMSAARSMATDPDPLAVATSLHARYLVLGSMERVQPQLLVTVEMTDAASGVTVWRQAFEFPQSEAGALQDKVLARVSDALHISVESSARTVSAESVNLDSYQLFTRGQQLMLNQRVADVETAIELFRRATTLDPTFARGYLGLAQAQILGAALSGADDSTEGIAHAQAKIALDRALTLNPALGEAWIERARLTKDPTLAEPLFRRGLDLSPSYGLGYMRYAEFLFGEYRKGEMISAIERARQLDPLDPRLAVRQAMFLMIGRSDVAGHDRLILEALALNPKMQPAMAQLAHSRYEYTGQFAEGIRLIEQSIALDPQSQWSKDYAATMYLDVDDPKAAEILASSAGQSGRVLVEIAQYRGNRRLAAQLARNWSGDPHWSANAFSPLCEAIRDEAIDTGDYAAAVKMLEKQYAIGAPANGRGGLVMWNRSIGIVYAHTLILAGEVERGRKLAEAILTQIDSESVGRTEHWFSRERAALFALLGDDERALEELAASLQLNFYARWWYTAELNPIYHRLRGDARFQAMATKASQHRALERQQVDELRNKGVIPKRTIASVP